MNHHLRMYVLYHNPTDYPDKWVLRRWTIKPGGPVADYDPMAVEDSREKAVTCLEWMDLYRIARDPRDQDQIKEIWL
jgi:hypothetical protein